MRYVEWFGAKKFVKRVVSVQPFNYIATHAIRAVLPADKTRRLPVSVAEVSAVVGGRTFIMTEPSRCQIAKELFWGRRAASPEVQRGCTAEGSRSRAPG